MPPIIALDYEIVPVGDNGAADITFTAQGENIELWQWDWDYDEQKGFAAEVLRSNEGTQTQRFPAGTHTVAVRGTDTNGISTVVVRQITVG